MNAPIIAVAAATGAAAGPWLRASIFAHHVAEGRPRRSRCPRCRHPLGRGWHRRLPATGRCPRYARRLGAPLQTVEATTAADRAVTAWRAPGPLALILLGGLAVIAVLLSFIDLGVHPLPDPIVAITAAAVTAVITIASASSADPWRHLAATAISATICEGFYRLWALLAPDSVGLGALKWAAVLALVTGWLGVPVLAVLAAGALIAAVTMGALLALRRVHRHQAVAFGAFLSAGVLTALALDAL